MKSINKPSTVLYFKNKLVKVVAIGAGKTIHMEVMEDADKDKCPHCGNPIPTEFDALEHSPLFQSEASPVVTLEETQ